MALQHQWVQEYKWLLGERLGRDIGVPHTVGTMLRLSLGMQDKKYFPTLGPDDATGFRGLSMFDRARPELTGELYQLMVNGYLLGTDYVSPLWVMKPNGTEKPEHLVQTGIVPDEHGANQLEGEIRRHWARRKGIEQPESISSIAITPLILEHYCRMYALDNGVQFGLGKKLFL